VGAVASGASCAQLVGIDETSGNARAGDSVALLRMSVGKSLALAPLDLTGLQATYFVANAGNTSGFDRVTAVEAGQGLGTWTADLTEPAPVEFTLPGLPRPVPPVPLATPTTPVPRMFGFPASGLSVLYDVLEHPNPEPAPAGAVVTANVTLETATTATDHFQIYTVGSWTRHEVTAAEVPVPATALTLSYAFGAATNLSTRSQPDRLTQKDAFLVLRYTSSDLTGVAEADPFDQTGTDVVNTTMVTVAHDQTLDVKVTPATLMTRYTAVRPAVNSPPVMNWQLLASPGYRIGSIYGPVLQSGMVTGPGVTASYGNPFVAHNWNTMFWLQTYEPRPFMAGTPMSVTLYAGMNQFIEPTTAGAGFELQLPAGLPELISFNGTPLSNDGQTVAQPTKFVTVTFVADTPVVGASNATLFSLNVYDLLPNATATGLDYHFVFGASGNAASFNVPPEVFQVGHSYTLRATCTLGGYPGIATGDFTSRELPMSESYLDSGVFTVTQ